jgi:DNA-binding HxlR family transcriptional regulator
MTQPNPELCPRFHQAVELIGRRWTGAIIRVLQQGRTRFKGLASAIPEMTDRMLSERLRELEQEGIVTRFVIPETPVRVEYELTEKGRALDQAFCSIAQWAERWIPLESADGDTDKRPPHANGPGGAVESVTQPSAISASGDRG